MNFTESPMSDLETIKNMLTSRSITFDVGKRDRIIQLDRTIDLDGVTVRITEATVEDVTVEAEDGVEFTFDANGRLIGLYGQNGDY